MGTMGVFDRLTGDGERSDADVHHECRECGRTLSREATECPDCGGDVATYEL
jgi:rubrerythrin